MTVFKALGLATILVVISMIAAYGNGSLILTELFALN